MCAQKIVLLYSDQQVFSNNLAARLSKGNSIPPSITGLRKGRGFDHFRGHPSVGSGS